MTIRRLMPQTLAMLGLALAAPAHAQISCPQFAQMAQAALPPQVGSPGLVGAMLSGAAAASANPISIRFDPRRVQAATGSKLQAGRTCPKNADRRKAPASYVCEYAGRPDPEIVLSVDMPDGRLTYLNPRRRFDPAGPDNDVTAAEALAIASEVAGGFGVPPTEIDLAHSEAHARMLASQRRDRSAPPAIRRTEVVALLRRAVNGFPVLDSKAHVAVGADGAPARVHVVWPDFTLAAGLGDAGTSSRAEMVGRIVEQLGAFSNSCGAIDRLLVQVGWVPGDASDTSDETGTPEASGRYVPGIRVRALPVETGEDSDAIADFVHHFTLPLVTVGAGVTG